MVAAVKLLPRTVTACRRRLEVADVFGQDSPREQCRAAEGILVRALEVVEVPAQGGAQSHRPCRAASAVATALMAESDSTVKGADTPLPRHALRGPGEVAAQDGRRTCRRALLLAAGRTQAGHGWAEVAVVIGEFIRRGDRRGAGVGR